MAQIVPRNSQSQAIKVVCFSTVSPSKKFTKLNFALRRNKFARLADRIDNFQFGTTGSFAEKRGGGASRRKT
ncbi:MAG: hypothetical protein U1E51_25175 [Candidatus Binatia bacterium]|nr:hypothetical protein [Candidatus Binatia bacterium]